jgi:hypothetical protein
MEKSRSYLLVTLTVMLVLGGSALAVYVSMPGAVTLHAAAVPLEATLQATPSVEVPQGADSEAANGDTPGTTRATGVPAIQPSILGALPNVPAFTEGDVRKYASSYTDGFGRIRFSGGPPSIDKIQFLTPAALRALTVEAASLQLDDFSLLCYVVYSGEFVVEGPPGSNPINYKHAMQIFDAHSGYLLAQVAYERK